MSIIDIFYIGLSGILGVAFILGTGLFVAFAIAMQKAERAQK